MSYLLRAAALIGALTLIGPAVGQTAAPKPGCTATAHAQFDFWLGEWDLRWTDAAGKEGRGFNRITRIHGGCALLEEFDGKEGSPLRGTSLSLFDAAVGKWKQVWVDNQGSWLDFEGGVADGTPLFSRRAPKPGNWQRMVFRDVQTDALIWDWETSGDDGKTWSRQWRIFYTRPK